MNSDNSGQRRGHTVERVTTLAILRLETPVISLSARSVPAVDRGSVGKLGEAVLGELFQAK